MTACPERRKSRPSERLIAGIKRERGFWREMVRDHLGWSSREQAVIVAVTGFVAVPVLLRLLFGSWL